MRTHLRYLLALIALVSTGIIGAVVALPAQGASEIKRGAEVAPIPLNMKGLNPALVREGSFIVNAQGGCNDCHTVPQYAPGGNPFFGQPEIVNEPCYLAGGGVFGPFVSRNITPRADGRPAGRTLDEFKQLMRIGTDFRNDGTPTRDSGFGIRDNSGSGARVGRGLLAPASHLSITRRSTLSLACAGCQATASAATLSCTGTTDAETRLTVQRVTNDRVVLWNRKQI